MYKYQNYYNKHTITYYVIFTDSHHKLFKPFLKKHFGHAYILTHDDFNWLVLNPGEMFLRWSILPFKLSVCAYKKITLHTDSIIKITVYQRDNKRSASIIGLRTCVSLTKYFIGVNIRALTPYGLFKGLLSISDKHRKLYGIETINLIM